MNDIISSYQNLALLLISRKTQTVQCMLQQVVSKILILVLALKCKKNGNIQIVWILSEWAIDSIKTVSFLCWLDFKTCVNVSTFKFSVENFCLFLLKTSSVFLWRPYSLNNVSLRRLNWTTIKIWRLSFFYNFIKLLPNGVIYFPYCKCAVVLCPFYGSYLVIYSF